MDRIAENFAEFHAENPQVFNLFDRFTRQAIAAGHKRGSAKQVFERIRWETAVYKDDLIGRLKLNNNMTALYARLWEERNPEHRGFFAKRKRRAHTFDSTEFAEAEG